VTTATKSRSSPRGAGRPGRPPREQAGEVDQRILDSAQRVFLERGLEGASVDEIAEVAHAGKPTIYARFPHKEALFAAVMERMVQRRTEAMAASKLRAEVGSTIEERLTIFATLLLESALVDETIALVRVAIAEAQRFPELASAVHRMLRTRGDQEIGRVFAELTAAADPPGAPAVVAGQTLETARRFVELAVLPLLMRGLFGEPSPALHDEIDGHVRQAVRFFLAAYERG